MKKRISIFLIVTSAFLLGGCYPDGPEYVEDLDVVLTAHNKDYNYTGKTTYAMPDKIVKITGKVIEEGGSPEYLQNSKRILDMIDANMLAYGWTKVLVDDDPDVLLLPASWETTTIYYWYDYWSWWYGGYWGWYYPYYPPVSYSSYTTGTLLMSLIDPNEVSTDEYPIKVWTGVINGLLTGSYNETRVREGVDKAFSISDYLDIN
jgi:hypothetical protein